MTKKQSKSKRSKKVAKKITKKNIFSNVPLPDFENSEDTDSVPLEKHNLTIQNLTNELERKEKKIKELMEENRLILGAAIRQAKKTQKMTEAIEKLEEKDKPKVTDEDFESFEEKQIDRIIESKLKDEQEKI